MCKLILFDHLKVTLNEEHFQFASTRKKEFLIKAFGWLTEKEIGQLSR